LLSLPSARIDEGIDFALAEIGHFLDVDRCYLFRFDEQTLTISNSHEWISNHCQPEIANLQKIPVNELPWFWKRMLDQVPVPVDSVADLPPEARVEQVHWQVQEIKALLVVPLLLDGSLSGFIGVDAVRSERHWTDTEARLLRMAGEFISANLERQRAWRMQHNADQRFIAMTDAVPALIWELDPDGQVTYGNRSWKEFTGCDQSVRLETVVHEEERGRVLSLLQAAAKGQTRSDEMRLRRADGSYRWMQVTGAPRAEGEDLLLINCSAFDITDHRIAEEQLLALNDELEVRVAERTQKLQKAFDDLKMAQTKLLQNEKMASIGQLAAGVAHEINNPVGFIRSNLTTLGKYVDKLRAYLEEMEKACDALPEERRDELNQLRKSCKISYLLEDIPDLLAESVDGADRVRTIVQNLKSFSRVDQSQYTEADINECLESTINIVWNELKYKTTLHKELGDVPRIRCYPQQLNQVFMNILLNAAQAIETQGDIWVRTFVDNDQLVVHIQDNGCGIPEEIREKIFEPFFTTKEVGKGTGLGMSISWDIVHKHGGRIEIESQVGVGTSFFIYLPLSGAPDPDGDEKADGGQ
ncbi:MAG: PAS domain S-box protein, partial [Deltaproteobacteria bacterium]